MKHLIIGHGEVGQGLEKVLIEQDGKENVDWIDVAAKSSGEIGIRYEVLHICIPYIKSFVKEVCKYINAFYPSYCIIHSTVPVGTTREISNVAREDCDVVYSPIQGTHPELEKGIKAFRKWIGVENNDRLDAWDGQVAKRVFKNIRCKVTTPFEVVELAKLLDLSRYGLLISFAREQEEICKEHGVMYAEVVKEWELDYNEGLMLEGRSQYIRPIIYPPKGTIGGHCVVSAMEKVKGKSKLVEKALELNSEVEREYDARLEECSTQYNPFGGKVEIGEEEKSECICGEGVVLGKSCTIGDRTKIWHYVNIMDGASIGEACTIGSFTEIGRGVHIGDDCKVEAGVFIPEGVWISNRVFIGPNVVFTNDKCPRIGKEWELKKTFLHDGVSIGANATIVCGVDIGRDAVIGAGAVVTKSVPPGETVCGCPARKLEKKPAEELVKQE